MKGDSNYVKAGKDNYIRDNKAAITERKWKEENVDKVESWALSDVELWGKGLSALPGFEAVVAADLRRIIDKSALTMAKIAVGGCSLFS